MLRRHKQRRKNKAGEGNETDNRASGCYAINCRNYDGICIKWTLVWLNSQLIVCNWLHLACSTSQTERERESKKVCVRALAYVDQNHLRSNPICILISCICFANAYLPASSSSVVACLPSKPNGVVSFVCGSWWVIICAKCLIDNK